MSKEESGDATVYKVVVNQEEQYSIWPADRENARGWTNTGKKGTKKQCLAYIEQVSKEARPPAEKKK